MLCTRCKKRPAVIFITKIEGEKTTQEGLCLVCAKELKIPQVNDIIAKMGISDEDLEEISEQMGELISPSAPDDAAGFSPGGPATFPPFLSGIIGNLRRESLKAEGEKQRSEGRPSRGASERRAEAPRPGPRRKALNSFCADLTRKAAEGRCDRVIGREREIGRMIQILSRRSKNNPCLIGEPGVGKTAIVEGLAQMIVSGKVPFMLQKKEIFLLDLTALIAGTQFRGQFEGRIKSLIDEVKADGNIILFIDEVHNIAGAGDNTDGGMSAANLMKPALSRGEIQVIGATTLKEYRKSIEKDAALERRFQPVMVEEPSVEETVRILEGLCDYYEDFHAVTVPRELLRSAAELSERYINDRFLPDKAIDLLDEACACAALRCKALQEYRKSTAQTQRLQGEIDALSALEPADSDEERDKRYADIANLQAQLLKEKERSEHLEPRARRARVSEDDLARVIELWTGIDAGKVRQSDLSKLAALEGRLKERIIGQDEAVEALASAIRRTRIRLYEKKRPVSFIFAGPTGVGKTELVKVLAQTLFDTPDSIVRIDMSEYMEKHAVSRLIGAPPGYVGYSEAGQLTEKIRRRPYSVVLFDEIEKAHPDVMNILLQILDDGKVTDASGRDVDFSNTVIVMTTNAGSDISGEGMGFAKTGAQLSREKTEKALSQFLRPEFLGRVDETIIFSPLSEETLVKIAALMLGDIKEGLQKQGVTFGFSREVCEKLAAMSAGSKYGARQLRRNVRIHAEDKIGDAVVANGAKMPGLIKLDVVDGEITVISA